MTATSARIQSASPPQQPTTTAPPPPRPRQVPVGLVAAGAAVLVGIVALVALTLGTAAITPSDIVTNSLTDIEHAIVWQGRAPRVATAILVGAGLAMAGSVMQALLRNPLADPYLLGLSSGASLGAVAVVILGLGLVLPIAAFAGAMLALAATLALAGAVSRGRLTPGRTILAGVAVGQGCAAITSFIVFLSAQGEAYREVLGWLLGTLSATSWTSVAIAGGGLAVAGAILLASTRTLDAFAFGDTAAAALGVNVARTRWLLLGTVALLVGALVSVSGSIGFVGLVVPHAVRLLVGARQARVVPLAAIAGALVLLVADMAARIVVAPSELPVGILTAAIGAPVFALLMLRRSGLPA